MQLLRDKGILRLRAEAGHDVDVEEAEGWVEDDNDVIIPMPGQDLVSVDVRESAVPFYY